MNHNNKKELFHTAIKYQTEWEKKVNKCNSIKLSTTPTISRDKHYRE